MARRSNQTNAEYYEPRYKHIAGKIESNKFKEMLIDQDADSLSKAVRAFKRLGDPSTDNYEAFEKWLYKFVSSEGRKKTTTAVGVGIYYAENKLSRIALTTKVVGRIDDLAEKIQMKGRKDKVRDELVEKALNALESALN